MSKEKVREAIALSFAKSTYAISKKLALGDEQQSVNVTVMGWSHNHGKYEVKLADGSLRYCDYVGNKAIAAGQSLAAVFPINSLYGWIDSKVI